MDMLLANWNIQILSQSFDYSKLTPGYLKGINFHFASQLKRLVVLAKIPSRPTGKGLRFCLTKLLPQRS